MVSVYGYTDYRTFLRDWWEARRSEDKRFSCRRFAQKAGFRSSGFLNMVISGDRNLTEERIAPLTAALKLDAKEAAFFTDLVMFNQAESSAEKNHHYQRMMRCRQFLSAHRLEKERFEYFSRWYYVAIREMVALPGFQEDPAWICSRLTPRIEESEVVQAIATLERLGLVARDAKGRLILEERNVGTDDLVQSLHLTNFHQAMIRRGADAVSKLPTRDRTVSSITVPMSRRRFAEVRQRIHEFRKELRAMLEQGDEAPEEVFQINLHAFTLTGEGHE